MKFETKQINIFGDLVQIPLPKDLLPTCERLAAALTRENPLQVEITAKRKKRSVTANMALWAMLQDLAVVLKTTAEELYIDALRKCGKAVILKRGSLITSRKKLAERWNWSERKVRTFLSGLEREQQIACQAGNKFSVITVLNYGAYQDKKEAEHMSGQQNDQVNDQQTIQVKPALQVGGAGFSDQQSDQVSDQQNDHKQEDKEDKEYIISSRARSKPIHPTRLTKIPYRRRCRFQAEKENGGRRRWSCITGTSG